MQLLRKALLLGLILVLGQPTQASTDTPIQKSLEACVAALSVPTTGNAAFPGVLEVRSWNIMKEQLDGARALGQTLRERSTLLLTQEAVAQTGALPDDRFRYFAPGYRRGDTQTGVALTTRFPADVVCTLRFREPILRTPKAALVARLPFADHALLVVNVHGINFTLDNGAYRRQLAAIGTAVRAHIGPVLVAGDFNHWNPWRRTVLAEFARDALLREARFLPDWRSRHLGTPVDSAFVRDMEVFSAWAMPTELSDHHPLLLRLGREHPIKAGNHVGDGLPEPMH